MIMLLLLLVVLPHDAFVTFSEPVYSLSYCTESEERGCECYEAGYSAEYISCEVVGDVHQGIISTYCSGQETSSCLGAGLSVALPGCAWDDGLQAYFQGTCTTSAAIQWATYEDQDCAVTDTVLATQEGWIDMGACPSAVTN